MQLSYSRVSTFERNPLEYKLRYLEKLDTLPDFEPTDPLILGTAMHELIQKNQNAIQQYYMSYPLINDKHIEEAIKLELLSKKVLDLLPEYGFYEVTLSNQDYIGFIDMLVKNDDGTFDIYDFKYSNSIDNYMKSAQLHLYKYYFEQTGRKVKHLRYVFIPKIRLKQKKTESEYQFRQRLKRAINKDYQIKIKDVEYNPNKVIEWLTAAKHMSEATEFPLNEDDPFWKYSPYRDYVEKGLTYNMVTLPENKRRILTEVTRRKLWIYGAPFTGKTTFANEFPDPLMLNTDGNTSYVDAPVVPIKDEVTTTGRRTSRKFAWQVFKEYIDELEKKDNDFKTIVVDLVEDLYESCRLYMYDKLGIEHESDDPFKAWDEVRTEFLSTMRRVTNLDYENIVLISHEDSTKDILSRAGAKLTTFKPNIQEKVANKIAGMVDLVCRVVVEDNEHILSFKTTTTQFGGGRLSDLSVDSINLNYDELVDVYNTSLVDTNKPKKRKQTKIEDVDEEETQKAEIEDTEEKSKEEKPKTRKRKKREEPVEDPDVEKSAEDTEEKPKEEKPRRRRRRTRQVEED
ncbi:AAA family ATPase [Ligilactobacillus salivarius]|nr:AAA family ATPase [Ligilactobacillus salivarius]ADJ78929.1 Phage NTP-binding protein [Ligilactobacillus salivarius CECT 5713]OQQ76360.1 NTP-binding protein [Ligilactobacillus salivarius]OQR20830.1 NTP-binding protein [Ligilactobacillus salivarius]